MLVRYLPNQTVYDSFGLKTRSLLGQPNSNQPSNDPIGQFGRVDPKLWPPLILTVRILYMKFSAIKFTM